MDLGNQALGQLVELGLGQQGPVAAQALGGSFDAEQRRGRFVPMLLLAVLHRLRPGRGEGGGDERLPTLRLPPAVAALEVEPCAVQAAAHRDGRHRPCRRMGQLAGSRPRWRTRRRRRRWPGRTTTAAGPSACARRTRARARCRRTRARGDSTCRARRAAAPRPARPAGREPGRRDGEHREGHEHGAAEEVTGPDDARAAADDGHGEQEQRREAPPGLPPGAGRRARPNGPGSGPGHRGSTGTRRG